MNNKNEQINTPEFNCPKCQYKWALTMTCLCQIVIFNAGGKEVTEASGELISISIQWTPPPPPPQGSQKFTEAVL